MRKFKGFLEDFGDACLILCAVAMLASMFMITVSAAIILTRMAFLGA